jgi:hypothetical protein
MNQQVIHDRRVRAFDGVSALLGLWLIVSPYVLGAPGASVRMSGTLVGALILVLAIIRVLYKRTTVIGLALVLLAAWTIMSPWVLGETSGDLRTWNYIVVGMIVAVMEAFSLSSSAGQPNWRQTQTGRR